MDICIFCDSVTYMTWQHNTAGMNKSDISVILHLKTACFLFRLIINYGFIRLIINYGSKGQIRDIHH